MSLDDFKKKMENFEGLYPLNLAVEEERDYYLETVGGEENLKSNYPALYHAFLKSCEMAADGSKNDQEEDNVHFTVYDIVNVPADMDKKDDAENYHLAANISGSFLDKKKLVTDNTEAEGYHVSLNGKIYDPDSPRLAYMQIYDSFSDINQLERQYLSETLYRKEEFWDRKLKTKITISVYDSQNAMKSYVYSKETVLGSPMNFPIENIRFDAPVSLHPETNEIRILYGRTAQNLEKPDYIYASNNADEHGGKLWTIVPIKGEVVLKNNLGSTDYFSFEVLSSPEQGENMARSTLQYEGKDWKIYRNDKKDAELYQILNDGLHFKVTADENKVETLTFDLFHPDFPEGDDRRYDWAADIDKASTDNRERICYLTGGFGYDICKKNAEGKVIEAGTEYQIICQSVRPENLPKGRSYYTFSQGSTTIYIPPIHLWWGCLAKDTRVKTREGFYRRMDEVRMGDRLVGYAGKILEVEDVIKGMEEKLLHIRTADGRSIRVTGNHPILKEEKVGVCAERLSVGEKIQNEEGALVAIESIEWENYRDMVYNLTFRNETQGNYFIADGLFVGDFYAQNENGVKRRTLTEEEEQLIREMEMQMQRMQRGLS